MSFATCRLPGCTGFAGVVTVVKKRCNISDGNEFQLQAWSRKRGQLTGHEFAVSGAQDVRFIC